MIVPGLVNSYFGILARFAGGLQLPRSWTIMSGSFA
jgi:hypothetical protein